MHDLPSQTLLQQAHARSVSGEELEVFGKKAAATYASGECETLTEAVVETVKHAGLSPEQVRRVVEFTNQNAYLTEFRKESADHKYVEFQGGPASPSEVLKDLNDGGGGTVFDRGTADYSSPPVKTASALRSRNRAALGLEKTASAGDRTEEAFAEMWGAPAAPLPYADPMQDSIAMREKLATARDNINSDLSMLETEYLEIGDHLFDLVKQAALGGTPLGHIIQAWQDITPGDGYVKAAFALVGPRLVEQEVFPSLDGVAASLSKTASAQSMPNHEHPLLKTFAGFCAHLDKLASTRLARDEVADCFRRIDGFVKKASLGGVAGKVWQGAGRAGEALTQPVGKAVDALAGREAADLAAKAVRYAPKAALVAGGYAAGRTVYDHAKYGPVGRAAHTAASFVPGTDADQYRQMMIAQRYMQ